MVISKNREKIYLQELQVSICAKNIWRQFLYRITGQETKISIIRK